MAVPHFLNTGFKYREITGISDVQQIIDAFVDMIRTPDETASGWKRWYSSAEHAFLEAGEYESTEAYTRVFVKITRASATRLDWRVRAGSNGVIICTRSLVIPAANWSTARLFAGDGHACIDVLTHSALAEYCWAGTLDQRPDTPGFVEVNTTWGGGSRRTSDGVRDNYDNWDYAFMQEGDETPNGTTRGGQYRTAGGSYAGKRMPSGAIVYRPRELWAKVRGDISLGTSHWVGRCFQTIIVPDTVSPGTRLQVPIDTGVLGEFVVLCGVAKGPSTCAAMRSG
jgi:hypothetical protein